MQEDKDQSLISHLEELRKTVIRCLISVAVVLPFAFYIAPKVLDEFIKIIISKNTLTLNYFSPMEVFIIQLKFALLISFIIAFPYIVKNVWGYIAPALYEKERNFIKKIVLASTFLFILGGLFCLYIILPLIVNFGLSFSNDSVNALFGISNIINLSLGLVFVFGLMFQIPLVVNFIIKYDIVSYNSISSLRPYIVVVLLICCAILTPPDVISQILLFIPTYLLFETGLLFSLKHKEKP